MFTNIIKQGRRKTHVLSRILWQSICRDQSWQNRQVHSEGFVLHCGRMLHMLHMLHMPDTLGG